MWSSYQKRTNKTFASSTSSTSSTSSSSPLSQNPRHLKTMEEVWKDINLPSLPGKDPHITNLNLPAGVNLQDFLAQPFSKNIQKTSIFPSTTGYTSPAIIPATFLTLNSGPDFPFAETNHGNHVAMPNVMPFHGLGSAKKRHTDPEENTGDRRHKRMIKNRESAARSRARKQAYTSELELEIQSLKEENARLKKQQKLRLEETSQLPTKHNLYRTTTAPF